MALAEPPIVQQQPDQTHVLIPHWVVPLRIDGRSVEVTGQVLWVPGPSPWPWVLIALVAGLVVLAVARTRFAVRGVDVALVAGGACAAWLAPGSWRFSTGTFAAHVGATVYEIGAAVLAGAAAVLVARRPRLYDSSPVVLLAGLVLAVGAGFANVTWLFRSQLPTTVATSTARMLVAGCIGLGIGLAAVGALHLRDRDRARPVRAPRGSEHTPGAASPSQLITNQ